MLCLLSHPVYAAVAVPVCDSQLFNPAPISLASGTPVQLRDRVLYIRSAESGDQWAVLRLMTSIRSLYGVPTDWSLREGTVDSDLADISRVYDGRRADLELVFDETGQLVATVGFAPLAPGDCELRKLYADKSVRGLSLGRWLVERVKSKAKAAGCQYLRLKTYASMTEAIELYKRTGFQSLDKESWPYRLNSPANAFFGMSL